MLLLLQIFPNFYAAFKEANPEMELLRTPMCLVLKGYKYADEDENGDNDMQTINREYDEEDDEEDDEDMEMYPDEEEEPLGLVWLHEMQVCVYHYKYAIVQIFSLQ